jgi:hypothetical protein
MAAAAFAPLSSVRLPPVSLAGQPLSLASLAHVLHHETMAVTLLAGLLLAVYLYVTRCACCVCVCAVCGGNHSSCSLHTWASLASARPPGYTRARSSWCWLTQFIHPHGALTNTHKHTTQQEANV